MSPLVSFLPFCSPQSRRLVECLLSAPSGQDEGPLLADTRKSIAADIAVVDEAAELAGCHNLDPSLREEICAQARQHIAKLQQLLAVLTEDDDADIGAEALRIRQIQEDLHAGESSLRWPSRTAHTRADAQSLLNAGRIEHSTHPRGTRGDDERET